jgi:Flp pilus assembly protein CpaB
MVLAGALGVLLTLSVLRAADRTQPVLVAAHDLAPGTVIDDGDVRVARVHAGGPVLATLFGPRDLPRLRGQVVTGNVASGALVARTDVRAVGSPGVTRVMSFPLPRARAVGGKLAPGDRVDLVAVDRGSGRAGYVLTDAEVIAVDGPGGGPLGRASDDVTVTLAVGGEDAPRLAAALEAGTVTLVRATGAAPLRDTTRFAPSGSPGVEERP